MTLLTLIRKWYEQKMCDLLNGKPSRIPVVDRATYKLGWNDGHKVGNLAGYREGFKEGFDICKAGNYPISTSDQPDYRKLSD